MAELFLANLKNKFFFLISVQVDILVRPYTMDFIPPAKILTRLNSWSTLKKGGCWKFDKVCSWKRGTLAAEFLSKLGPFEGKLAKKMKEKGQIDESTFQ